MKKYILVVVVAAMIFGGVSSSMIVAAQENITATPEPQTQSQNENSASDREKRLEEYKGKTKNRISIAEQNRIRSVCVASQVKIKALTSRVNNFSSRRTKVYEEIKNKTTDFVDELKLTTADTTKLDAAIIELTTMSGKFSQDLDIYQITLTDLYQMDCSKDPVAFKSAVDVARTERNNLNTQSNEIKTFVVEAVVPLLQQASTDPMLVSGSEGAN